MKKVVLLLSIVIFLFQACNKGKQNSEQEAYQRMRDSTRIADSIKTVQAVELELALEQARLDSIARAAADFEIMEGSTKYHIIVGSFITPEYARAHTEYYISQGYDAKIYTADNGFDLVSAMDLENLSEAVLLLERFKDTVDFEAWLYIYPLN